MSCCVRFVCCVGVVTVCGPILLCASICSPSFRKAVREEWAKETKTDAEFDAKLAEMTKRNEDMIADVKSRQALALAKSEARMREAKALMDNDPEFRAKVERMVAGGIPREEALEACIEKLHSDKETAHALALIREGIPQAQAYKMARNQV
jgi:hypothetical protein